VVLPLIIVVLLDLRYGVKLFCEEVVVLFGNLKGINEEENVVELKVELGIELLRLGSLKGIRELMVKVELIVGLVELAMVEVIFVLDRDGVTVEDIT